VHVPRCSQVHAQAPCVSARKKEFGSAHERAENTTEKTMKRKHDKVLEEGMTVILVVGIPLFWVLVALAPKAAGCLVAVAIILWAVSLGQ